MNKVVRTKESYKLVSRIDNDCLVMFNYAPHYDVMYQEDEDGNITLDNEGNPIILSTELSEDMCECNLFWFTGGTPDINDIRNGIEKLYNEDIDKEILQGHRWNDTPVWLSSENQFNYKAAYDLAVLTNGKSLPVTYKLGTDENPVYHTFNDIEEFTDFYVSCVKHINDTLARGWEKKSKIDYTEYQDALNKL